MSTRVDAYQLLEAVKQGSQARMVKGPPVLRGVLLRRINGSVQILSTDTENFEAGKCPAFGDEETWEIILPSREWGRSFALPILDWLRALNPQKSKRKNGEWQCDVMTLEVLPGVQTLKVKCGRTTAHFKGIDAQEFPLIPREKIDAKLSNERVKPERKKRKRPLSEEVLARAAEEAWQKALKKTKHMGYEQEVEYWKTWLPLLEDHQAEIEKRLVHLGDVAEKCKRADEEWQAECHRQEDEEHQARLERFAWLEPVREGLRAEFESTLRRDKREQMNHPVHRWPFSGDEDNAPFYPTSYNWLEAGWIWQGGLVVGRGKQGSRWGKSHYRYFDSLLGYEVNRYQIAYAKRLSAKWYADHPRETISLEEINNPYGEEASIPNDIEVS